MKHYKTARAAHGNHTNAAQLKNTIPAPNNMVGTS